MAQVYSRKRISAEILSIGVLLNLALLSTTSMVLAQDAKAKVVECVAFPAPSIAYQSWKDDANYDLYESVHDGRKSIRVTGDILNISKADFGSIVRDIDAAPDNVAEIIFEGREVNFLDTISFKGARIVVLADAVNFASGGSIYLNPPGDLADGLFISTNTLAFREAMPRALQVPLGDGTSKRKVEIFAETMLVDGKAIPDAAARDTLWRRTGEYNFADPKVPPSFLVEVGTEGGAKANAAMAERVTWPLFFAFKVQKFYSRAPFAQANRKEIEAQISNLLPKIEKIGNASAVTMLNSTMDLMNLDLDAQGYSPFFVPRRDFVSARDAFKAKLDDAEARLDTLMDIILAAYDGKPLDPVKVEKVRADYRAALGDMTARQQAMSKALTDISVNEKMIVELNEQVADRRVILEKHLEDLKKKNDDASKIKIATTVVAIGAMMIPTPASPIIAAGLSVTGDIIYSHNVTPGGISLETFATIATRAAAFYKTATEARDAWDKHLNDLGTTRDAFKGTALGKDGKPIAKMDALKKAGASGGEFGKKLKEMYDQLQALPEPTKIEMSGLEKEDGELQGLLSSIGGHRAQQAKLIEQIAALQQQLASDTEAQATASVLEAELLEMTPGNDRDIMRWKTVATALWRMNLEDLYLDAIMLRRSLYFETAKIPELPADLLQFPEEMTAYVRSGLYSPDGHFSTKELILQHLEKEKKKHLTALNAINDSILRSFEGYQSERAGGAMPYTQTFTFDSNGSSAEREFLEQINAQISSISASDGINGTVRIPIPMTLPAAPLDIPERLVQVTVPAVEFKDPEAAVGKRINLDISYDLAGEMRRNGFCNFIDMRAKGAMPRVATRYQVGLQKVEETAPIPLTFEEFKKYQSAPPARTPYYLAVQMTGDRNGSRWKAVPQITSLTINLRVVQ
jgi:hypothetical protein